MSDQNPVLTATIGQLPPLEPELLSGDDSIEITVSTRADGGASMVRKSFRTTLNAVLSIYAARRDNPNEVTAEQVGTYTLEQIQVLLEGKLGVEGIAVNALRLDGKTRQEIVAEALAGTSANAEKLGGLPASDYLLVREYENSLVHVTDSINALTDKITLNPEGENTP